MKKRFICILMMALVVIVGATSASAFNPRHVRNSVDVEKNDVWNHCRVLNCFVDENKDGICDNRLSTTCKNGCPNYVAANGNPACNCYISAQRKAATGRQYGGRGC